MKKRILSSVLVIVMLSTMILPGFSVSAKAVYNVVFDSNGHGDAPSPLTGIPYGTDLTQIDTDYYRQLDLLYDNGKQFYGWSLKNTNDPNEEFYFSGYNIDQNLKLYAIWLDVITNVEFTFNAADMPEAGKAASSAPDVSVPDQRKNEYFVTSATWLDAYGNIFNGSFTDGSTYYLMVEAEPNIDDGHFLFRDTDGYDYDRISLDSVTSNGKEAVAYIGSRNIMTAYFRYTCGDVKTHTVTFETGMPDVTFHPLEVSDGLTIYQAICGKWETYYPTKDGYEFDDWYYEKTHNNFIRDDDVISGDITLYGDWEKASVIDRVDLDFRAPNIGEMYNKIMAKDLIGVSSFDAPYHVDRDTMEIIDREAHTELKDGDSFESGKVYTIQFAVYSNYDNVFRGGESDWDYPLEGRWLDFFINGEDRSHDIHGALFSYRYYNDHFFAEYDFIAVDPDELALSSDPVISVKTPRPGYSAVDCLDSAVVESGDCFIVSSEWYGMKDGKETVMVFDEFALDRTYTLHLRIVPKAGFKFTDPANGSTVNTVIKGNNIVETKIDPPDSVYQDIYVKIKLTMPFTDVPDGQWFTDAVKYCYERGIMQGMSDTIFAPNAPVTRAMFVTILLAIMPGEIPEATGTVFTDVPADAWFAKYVECAFKYDLTSGIGDGKFGPNDPVTREQICVFLKTFTQKMGEKTTESVDLGKYKDAGQISPWAKDAVSWGVAIGIISGITEDTLSPKTTATRAQIAVMIRKLFAYYSGK